MAVIIFIFLVGIGFAIYRRGPCFSREEEPELSGKRSFWRRGRKPSYDPEIMQAMRARKEREEETPFTPGTFLGVTVDDRRTSVSSVPRDHVFPPDSHDASNHLPVVGAPGTLLGDLSSLSRDRSKQSAAQPASHGHTGKGSLPRSLRSKRSVAETPFSPGTLLGDSVLDNGTKSLDRRKNSAAETPFTPGTFLGDSADDEGVRSLDRRSKKSGCEPSFAPGTFLGDSVDDGIKSLDRRSKRSGVENSYVADWVENNAVKSLDRRSRRSGRTPGPSSDSDENDEEYPNYHHPHRSGPTSSGPTMGPFKSEERLGRRPSKHNHPHAPSSTSHISGRRPSATPASSTSLPRPKVADTLDPPVTSRTASYQTPDEPVLSPSLGRQRSRRDPSSLGSTPSVSASGGARSGRRKKREAGRKEESGNDEGDDDDAKPLASIALASLQKNIGGV
ncbi:hypothetical protein HDU67_000150 [Dinochytrium kinnereticum]|nr:hypothetical protein HDU67_000150 [Dinochytrium kinnereticum]